MASLAVPVNSHLKVFDTSSSFLAIHDEYQDRSCLVSSLVSLENVEERRNAQEKQQWKNGIAYNKFRTDSYY